MSFTITQKLAVNKSYPELLLETDEGFEDAEVTYEVVALERMSGTTATVWYTHSVDGQTSAWKRQFDFEYDGTGSPIEAGELALKESFSIL
ncbi:hypothetical protein GST45_17825 [Serratia marcescens]|uniref:Uncharacterized protein n=1 Tax=Serratia marcescens TaxID=615 RepID=A0ABD5BHP9_SERMA|nr:hypothetical protein [Serratia marcescens]MDE5234318.1 hypothetical protein [Serratia marcescens]MDE5257515.1 hypothetical protein [Serratia marcescens]MDQ9402273.1 hypothetical protein [Serratia marcescens]MDQ9424676.1 hypothetical protein [Serratia marcescens]MDQ9433805.1 hypothetical protein [Serratia marcescens]